jgi:hypothetical protein
LICHGTVTERLGLDLAISAVASLRSEIPELRLKVIGDGDRLAESRALVDRLGLDSHVVFTDLVPVGRLPALLVTADMGLVPYRPSSATHLMVPVNCLTTQPSEYRLSPRACGQSNTISAKGLPSFSNPAT